MKRKLGMVLSVLLAGATALGSGAAVQAAPVAPLSVSSIGGVGESVLQVREGDRRIIRRGSRGFDGRRGYSGREFYRGRQYSGRSYYGRNYNRGRYYGSRRGSYGPALGLGFGLGLGTGYYFGGGYPSYSRPYYPAPQVYASRGSDWNRACAQRYRSFDWRSGTYLGYDGRRHLCRL